MSQTTISTSLPEEKISTLSINTIRFLAVDAVQKANSGHPGLPMGAAPMAYVLWKSFLKHNPKNPTWADRDRFVLSAGHGSMLIYALLHLTGYDLTLDELQKFRQLGSKTPGHPENFQTIGVETTTGPLGQGFATGVGMAVAESMLAARFNRPGYNIIDHYTYGIVSDGDLMEGVAAEATSLAGHLGLGKLIYLYDDNDISIDGSTDVTFTEDVPARFKACGWHVVEVNDGNDLLGIYEAIEQAKGVSDKPSLVVIRSIIGYGSPNKQGTAGIHGSPLGDEEVALTKKNLGWPEDAFFLVPDEASEDMGAAVSEGAAQEASWNALFESYKAAHPELADQFLSFTEGRLPTGWEDALPVFEAGTKLASRASSGKVINALAKVIPNLVGGSADLTGSNKTGIDDAIDYQRDTPEGRYFRFGVREHGMAALCNGISLHGGFKAYCGTFLIFSDYLRPALRLSALMRQPVIYVLTHDSIGQGEDGPTHQPVEHYLSLRAMPNLNFIRPADANEVSQAWRVALASNETPTVLALSRQGLPTFDRNTLASAEGLLKGGYILKDANRFPELILMASGSEVQLALAAAEQLEAAGRAVRVVSMPCWELFDAQPRAYKEEVLPPSVTRRVSIEAGVTMGWDRYTGSGGITIGLDRFGESAPGHVLFEHFGFTAESIAEQAMTLF